MPVLAGDNSYGVVSAISADYPHEFGTVAMGSPYEEASEKLAILLSVWPDLGAYPVALT